MIPALRARRRLALAAVAALAAAAVPGALPPVAAPDSPPAVAITVPINAGGCTALFPCLRGASVPVSATAAPAPGRTIASVEFQYSRAGAGAWTSISTDATSPYTAIFRPNGVDNGLYDFRVLARDSTGETGISELARDRLVAKDYRPATLADPGALLSGAVTLNASVQAVAPAGIVFQRSPEGAGDWTTIAADATATGSSPATYSVPFDTATAPDGAYDLRAVPTDAAGAPLPGIPRRGVSIDNGAPTAALSPPAGPLSGVASLAAGAADAGVGISAVRFERATAGTRRWTPIGARVRAPFELAFDTRALPDGRYDLRVIATDRAGNATTSPAVRAVVSNPGAKPDPRLSIENVAAPADDIHLLGAVTGSPQHEAWAWGYTSAPPAEVDGARLPYTSQGDQLVLLRYTDNGGWRIADVLRKPDGTAYPTREPADLLRPDLTGQVTASGEVWVALTRHPESGLNAGVALFHRKPGGRFVHDQAAGDALGDLASRGLRELRLGETADGRVYGTLVAPRQPPAYIPVPRPPGAPVTIEAHMDYGALADGRWTRRSAPLPSGHAPAADGEQLVLESADPTGPGAGWAALSSTAARSPLMLARFDGDRWSSVTTGLDALDLTDRFRTASIAVRPTAVRARGGDVWIDAKAGSDAARVIARYDVGSGVVTDSWCTGLSRPSPGCAGQYDAAGLPDAVFDTPEGPMALSLASTLVKLFVHGRWTRTPAPGYVKDAGAEGRALFTGPGEGWLAGPNGLGRVSVARPEAPLALWPQSNRAPLTGVALPPGGDGALGQSGALAVGLNGAALRYDAGTGWLVQPVPARASHVNLRAVAFAGPARAFAVGQAGTILRWDGASWSDDPQTAEVTQAELNSVAFAPSGEGWAVGRFGTILHFDGETWTKERPPAQYDGFNVTSVATAGSNVLAVIGGNLIERGRGGEWRRVDASLLPSDPAPGDGRLRLVAGLPDGGVIAAGRSVVLVRGRASEPFEYSAQPLEGIVVALAAFRTPAGELRAFASVAPPALNTGDVAGFPPGDGELLRQTAAGWEDLSRGRYAGGVSGAPTDGVVKVDPVLAIAPSPAGDHAWVVGGFAGTLTAAGFGNSDPLPARPASWQTASVWRYDAGGSAKSPAVTTAPVSLPAKPDTVGFAFFSSAVCKFECGGTIDAQPDVNLRAVAEQVATFGAQPGGPAFALFGGNARNRNASDFGYLPSLLAPLGRVPLYAALGPLDSALGVDDPLQPWSDAFAEAPAPFGPGPAPDAITPLGSGSPAGSVNRFYAFDAAQNGGRLRVIVLDNSKGSLEDSAPGQTEWLQGVLADAAAGALPVVVVAAQALRVGGARDGRETATLLARAGVLGVFTTYPADTQHPQLNERRSVPENAEPGEPTIPEYEGAAMGYQETGNNGVVWYSATVDTSARKLEVQAIPVVASLALKPLLGLSVARSSTLAFEAVGRRPVGTLPATPGASTTGIDNYVGIPAPSCGSRPCMKPSYRFASSDRTIGDFVVPSGPSSRFPKLDDAGHPTPSPGSGLFCAYNTGTTTVTVTSGLLTSSLPVTVEPGDIGRPCGTVFRAGVGRVVIVPRQSRSTSTQSPPGAGAPAPPPTAGAGPIAGALPKIALPPAPAPPTPSQPPSPAADRPSPPPPPIQLPLPAAPVPAPLAAGASLPPVAVPPIPPAIQPIPPGGSASAQAAARRKEKARKHASQSAYVTRPAGVSGAEWFYGAVGVMSVLSLLLVAEGMRPGPRARPAPLLVRERSITSHRRF